MTVENSDSSQSSSNSAGDASKDSLAFSAQKRSACQKSNSHRKGRRCTIDLTRGATEEVDRIKDTFGLTTADLFRYALTLLRIYVAARLENKQVQIVSPDNPTTVQVIELPLFVRNSTENS